MKQENQQLHNLRHSAAHLLAQAVAELFPGTKMTIGPVTEHGFFYDFLPTRNFKEEDLPIIEKKMGELVKKNHKIVGGQVSKQEAKKLFHDNQFKQELIDGIEEPTVGVYYQGDFYDLCRGGHVESLGQIKHVKLTGISGSYWRADRNGIALQRISGVAFASKEDMDAYFKRIEEAQLYDHRRLGKQLDLFSFHEEAPGMPFFHAKGLFVYNHLISYMRALLQADYQEIKTPLVMDECLWKKSGHYDFYKDNMYFSSHGEETCSMRPMNCPGAALVYKERPRSYRELPLRLSEFGVVHRYELSGVLHGLFRVRSFTQDDAHIFCTLDQLQQEVTLLIELAARVYKTFGFDNVFMGLSTRPEKSMGSRADWEQATNALQGALTACGCEFTLQEGEGAFYGPKIEIKVEDSMGRLWQCGTIQIDFNMPINFDLEYVAADQSRQRPVMVHRAIYGSIERFLGILLEHHKGRLPFWVAPVQVRLLTISDKQHEYARQIGEYLKTLDIRYELDETGDKISGKIRQAQQDKMPLVVVVGQKEMDSQTVTVRYPDGAQQGDLSLSGLAELVNQLNTKT